MSNKKQKKKQQQHRNERKSSTAIMKNVREIAAYITVVHVANESFSIHFDFYLVKVYVNFFFYFLLFFFCDWFLKFSHPSWTINDRFWCGWKNAYLFARRDLVAVNLDEYLLKSVERNRKKKNRLKFSYEMCCFTYIQPNETNRTVYLLPNHCRQTF